MSSVAFSIEESGRAGFVMTGPKLAGKHRDTGEEGQRRDERRYEGAEALLQGHGVLSFEVDRWKAQLLL
jgi:hypothetical protein